MGFRPGYFVPNLLGKQAGTPATTTANQNSSYVFSAGNTTIGSVAVVKKSLGTNPSYDSASATMTFNGSNNIVAYNPSVNDSNPGASIQVAPLPCSFQVDFNTTKSSGNQYVFNLGQGNGVGFPCFQVFLSNTTLTVTIGTANSSGTTSTWTLSTNIQANVWYRVGVFFYRVGNSNFIRTYLNGEIKNDVLLGSSTTNVPSDPSSGGVPRKDTTGFAIGGDNANFSGYNFQGQIRNFFFDNGTSFWTI